MIFSVALLAVAISLLSTGCAITDAFSSESDNAPAPQATATSIPTAEPDQGAQRRVPPDLRHRYVMSPPSADDYDPSIITLSAEDQYIADVTESWSRTSSVHFNLKVDGSTFLDVNETIELKSVEGDLKRPNRAQAEASVKISFASFDVGLVVIGDNVYTTNFLTGDWERGPSNFDFNPALIFDNERGVSAVLAKMEDVEIGNDSTIGGTRTVELTGTVAREDISQLVAGSLDGDVIGVSLWIDADTGDLLQISLSEPDDVEGDPTAWIITFSERNQPVTINAPNL
jgi:LppX_LprAFG lipoprotein